MQPGVNVAIFQISPSAKQKKYFEYIIWQTYMLANKVYEDLFADQEPQVGKHKFYRANILFRKRFDKLFTEDKQYTKISSMIKMYCSAQYAGNICWVSDSIPIIENFGWYTGCSRGYKPYYVVTNPDVTKSTGQLGIRLPIPNAPSKSTAKINQWFPIKASNKEIKQQVNLDTVLKIVIEKRDKDWICMLYYK